MSTTVKMEIIQLIVFTIKELGLINLTTVTCLINAPAIILFLVHRQQLNAIISKNQINMREHIRKDYVSKVVYEKESDELKKITKDLKEIVIRLDKALVIHDERIKNLNGSI